MVGSLDGWKSNTLLCLLTVIVLYLLVGLLFGVIFGYCFGIMDYLVPKALEAMFLISLVVVSVCYLLVPKTPYGCDKWVEITNDSNPGFNDILERLCGTLSIPKPRIYITSDPFPNAYALGRTPETAHICMTSGLIELFMQGRITEDELTAILSHELSHIAHRDTILMSVAGNCVKALSVSVLIFDFITGMVVGRGSSGGKRGISPYVAMFMVILSSALLLFATISVVTIPGVAVITHCAISRDREYLADKTGATICGKPMALASALRKLNDHSDQHNVVSAYDVSRWTVNPNGIGNHGFFAHLYDTHPPVEKRIRRLELMAEAVKGKPND